MDLKILLKTQWDRSTAVACTVFGALFLFVGWIGVSGTPFLVEQACYILSGGVGGMFLLGVGATLWISADLRDEWRKLDRIEAALTDATLRYVTDEPTEGRATSASFEHFPKQAVGVPRHALSHQQVPHGPLSTATPQDVDVLSSAVPGGSTRRTTPGRPPARPKRSRAGALDD